MFEQLSPGIPSTIPFISTQLVLLADGDLLEMYPWPVYGKNFAQTRYWGNDLSEDELIDLIVAMVVRRELQASTAIHFHFRQELFGNARGVETGMFNAFWSMWDERVTERMQGEIDRKLRSTDAIYALLCEFLEAPRLPRFRKLYKGAVRRRDLSLAYELGAR